MATPLSSDMLNLWLAFWRMVAHPGPPFFEGLPSEDLLAWFQRVESGCRDLQIPELQWADAAIFFLTGGLRKVMAGQKRQLSTSGVTYWRWGLFKRELIRLYEAAIKIGVFLSLAFVTRRKMISLPEITNSALQAAGNGLVKFRQNHPGLAAAGLIAAGSTVLLPTVGLAALGLAGFTSGGVVGGSLAATIQSTMYGSFTCGVFSAAQSFAATAVPASAPAVVAAAATAGTGIRSLFRGNTPSDAPEILPVD